MPLPYPMEQFRPKTPQQIFEMGKERALRQLEPGTLQGQALEVLRDLEKAHRENGELSSEAIRLAIMLAVDIDESKKVGAERLMDGLEYVRSQIASLSGGSGSQGGR